jgi:hypothetical protein
MLSRLTLIGTLIAISGYAQASEDSSTRCVNVSEPKAVVAAHNGRWTDLDANQWEFLRGIYAMNPQTPSGLPYGDHAALARFDGRPDGIVFFIDGDKACTPMVAPAELLSMMADVAGNTIKHEAAGL